MCWDCEGNKGGDPYKDFVHGKVEPEDGWVDSPYRPKAKVKARKRYPGCVGNEGRAHVFVWTTEKNGPSLFFDHYDFHKWESKVCVGCGHVDKRRRTEEYNRRNEKEFGKYPHRHYYNIRWFSFEDTDEAFKEKRKRRWNLLGFDDYC